MGGGASGETKVNTGTWRDKRMKVTRDQRRAGKTNSSEATDGKMIKREISIKELERAQEEDRGSGRGMVGP